MSLTRKQIREELENMLGEIKGQSRAVRGSEIGQEKLIAAIDKRNIPPKPLPPKKTETRVSPGVIRRR